MFIELCVAFLLGMGLYFGGCVEASNFDSDGKYLSHVGNLFEAHEKFHKPPKYGKDIPSSRFNVKNFGAKGDGKTDDTKAFMKAWTLACKVKDAIMLIPAGDVFLLQPITFDGNGCQSNPTFQVDGKVVAPNKLNWENIGQQWIMFRGFNNGLRIVGHGVFGGRGKQWWTQKHSPKKSLNGNPPNKNNSPHALVIVNSKRVFVKGVKIENSPQMHIFFSNCQQVTIINLFLKSPGDSPNTDGIHLSHTQHVEIRNSTLSCGDDCVSIQTGCSNVTISNVHCGPGHGYSIGSLGYNGQPGFVSDIFIRNSAAIGTSTGVRIKTWEGATGSVRNVKYENIRMSNVQIPIIIDQDYCNGKEFCHQHKLNGGAVAISDITYTNIKGTYTKQPVALVCSKYNPCRGLKVSDIDLKPSGGVTGGSIQCSSAHGKVLSTTNPSLEKCLHSH